MLGQIIIGDVTITPDAPDGWLRSIGDVQVGAARLRSTAARFLPWFDTYDGDVFRRFRLLGVEPRGQGAVIRTRAVSDPDVMFRERRDCSGDLCFRRQGWDAPALETELDICFEPVHETIDGRAFTGLKYWFEYRGGDVSIHRLIDRQTWEVGGSLDDVTLCVRNWLTPPRMRVTRDTEYSTVGLDKWAGLLPGNMWGRWTLLPAFDMQYGRGGVLLGWFDQVSLIRTVIESNAGEDVLRVVDMHLFRGSTELRTNPKTIVWSPDVLDDVDALNLWTRVQDRESEKARAPLGISEGPPAIVFSENVWRNFRFDRTYETVVSVAGEFGADYVFIDPVWEHQQAYQETLHELIPAEKRDEPILRKFWQQNMCVTLDFEVARILGGEQGLKALCERAAEKGVKIMSWMAAHYSPNSALNQDKSLGHGSFGIFAARESGRHPDTGYAASCWTANLHGRIYEKMREQLLGVCRRTGLAGFLWDSYCNLGWWQIDYSDGTMRPQWDRMMELYADLTKAGLYVMPEAIVTFSNHSCCGLHGGNVYAGDLLGYSYNTNIGLWHGNDEDHAGNEDLRIVRGKGDFGELFRCFAHRRVPSFSFHRVPRAEWDAASVTRLKDLLRAYKTVRGDMVRRTVLKNDEGVRWDGEHGEAVLWCFRDHVRTETCTDVLTGKSVPGGRVQAQRVYRLRDKG